MLRMRLASVLTVLLVCVLAATARAAEVRDVRVWRAPDHTRVVFDLSGPVDHKIMSLREPHRLVIDIDNGQLGTAPAGLDLADTPITRLRHGVRDKHDLRVVLDLTAPIKPRSFMLKPNGQYGHRLVVDLHDKDGGKRSVRDFAQAAERQRDIVIAIDAGHGGEDPGAIGPGNLQEKHVVMAIARELESLLKQQRGYRPVMVRTGDYYIPLKKRRDQARSAQADLMVSIHADAFHDPRARGGSVFALSQRGASSTMAAFLAAHENSADQIGGVKLADTGDAVLREVLTDLSMTASLDASLKVGREVLGSMGHVARLHSRRVEQAGFAVLKSPDIPSILVETGFISNPGEARQLRTSAYQKKMARAIYDGIHSHFRDSPPPDTYLAWVKRNQPRLTKYTVSRGDTLSGIAQRFQISLGDLISRNDLAPDAVIRVGQTIVIPAS